MIWQKKCRFLDFTAHFFHTTTTKKNPTTPLSLASSAIMHTHSQVAAWFGGTVDRRVLPCAASGGYQPPSLRAKPDPYEPSDLESQVHKFPVHKLFGHNSAKRNKCKATDAELCTWRKSKAANAVAMIPPPGGICDDMRDIAMRVCTDYVDVAVYAETDPEISALAGAVLYGDPLLDLPTLDEMKMSYKFAKVRKQQNTIARAYFGEKRMKEVPRLKTHKAACKAARKAAPAYTSHGCKVFPKSNGGVRIVLVDSDSDSDDE